MNITDCGAANLLAAVFGEDVDVIKARLGIEVPIRSCLNCGKPLDFLDKRGRQRHNGKYCSRHCEYEYTHIWLACEQCGDFFSRSQSVVISRLNRPQTNSGKPVQHLFCSHSCSMRWSWDNSRFPGRVRVSR